MLFSNCIFIILLATLPISLGIYLWLRNASRRNKGEGRPSGCGIVIILVFVLLLLMLTTGIYFVQAELRLEAKINLISIHTSQQSYFSAYDNFAKGENAFKLMSWEPPETQEYYTYYCSKAVYSNERSEITQIPPISDWPIDTFPEVSEDSFTCMAVGNIDADPYLDAWSIDDSKNLVNLSNDLTNHSYFYTVDSKVTPEEIARWKRDKIKISVKRNLQDPALFFGVLGIFLALYFNYRDIKKYYSTRSD